MTKQNTPTGIDLIQTAKTIWQKKGFIFIIVIISTLIGLSTRCFKTKKELYTATCTSLVFQPEETKSTCLSEGTTKSINFIQHIPIQSYPQMISSTPFLQKILTSNIQINDSLIPLYKWLNSNIDNFPNIRDTDTIIQLTSIQQKIINTLQKAISTDLNVESHTFMIKVSLKEPKVAATVAQKVVETFVKQINIIETQKQNEFIQSKQDQYNKLATEIKKTSNPSHNLLQKQEELREQLKSLQQKIQYQGSSFHIIEPVVLPLIPETEPSRSLLFFICTGFLFGIGLVLILPLIAEITENKYLSTWNTKKQ